MKIIITVLVVVAVLVLGALAYAYLGFATVAATEPGSAALEWYLRTARENAVEGHLADIQVPPLDDPAKLRTGLVHYQGMCVTCHGAPGIEPAELAQGLNPSPPELSRRRGRKLTEGGEGGENRAPRPAPSEERRREHAKETFWIVKNGIRMTGMPAFGPTHSDEDIWAMVALVERLRDLSPEEYASMVKNAGLSLQPPHSEEEEHEHGATEEPGGEMQGGEMQGGEMQGGEAGDAAGHAHEG